MRNTGWMVFSINLLLLSFGCGGEPDGSGSGDVLEQEQQMRSELSSVGTHCDITHDDTDCDRLGTSATDCRTRLGARYGQCVDDLGNLCSSVPHQPGLVPCIYDQQCPGWQYGYVSCTSYGIFGPRLCGACSTSLLTG